MCYRIANPFIQKPADCKYWDVNNGIARRNWARNEGATFAIKRAMEAEPRLKVTMSNLVEDKILENLF